ncbi:hypothetical protein Mp_3g05750 [Marchantia polymorpha subsp. ruderalis]|uniref:Glycosyl transferase 64 domain-containing protein n=2 Tax=Marchantia polymorpha TaxID=3197 RepID=A0A176WTH7_MARPO|nr:hypothetical protein AXG93_1356s1080 [Marchantia polymorpha subsp. ruderalis]PTQ48003.1 hypothetical protein MARPO_0006s0046 [Marchantia polymorpha]BBN04566.1 hypothetical protein Mp_3g05750 [Marchantia polymorpha subsp. ruderalis]|eukprot:PTQ48003.1 hypothetical protein MARPO_0006s0046 [Marchantia polymorpha]
MHQEGAVRNGMGSNAANVSFASLASFKDKAGMKGQRSTLQRWRFACGNMSYRVKLLTGCVVVLLALYCTSRAASIIGWDDQYPEVRSGSPRHRYTVLINTWKRYELLKKTVAHYSSCSNVDAVNVIWSEPQPPTKELHSKLTEVTERNQVEVRFNINKVDELNNRFKPIAGIRTDAVFSVDDDLVIPCPTMDLAFSVWLSAPRSMVGFVPRMHWPKQSDAQKHGREEYTYGGWWSVWWTGTYSMILTKASFLHKDYLDLYTNTMPSSILNFVKHERNCEDIAMSFLVANVTNASPLWVKGEVHEIGSTGISSLSGHTQHRTDCMNYFVEIFGHMPLVSTRVKATDASEIWFW